MRFLINAPPVPLSWWTDSFQKIAPEINLEIGITSSAPDEVECVLLWGYFPIDYSKFNNLKLIYSLGAGVDHIVHNKLISKEIPISRIVDPLMAVSMSNYIMTALLTYHRQWYEYIELKKQKQWAQHDYPDRTIKAGILGLGHLGMDIAHKIKMMGHEVYGYSISKKEANFPTYQEGQLNQFLSQINVLICLVPLTNQTRGILCRSLFSLLEHPTYLINVSRGGIQNEEDIIDAIDKGILTGACLDVFNQEPLPKQSPLWDHPKIMLTPHNASFSISDNGVRQVLENFSRVKKGKPILNPVSPDRMY